MPQEEIIKTKKNEMEKEKYTLPWDIELSKIQSQKTIIYCHFFLHLTL